MANLHIILCQNTQQEKLLETPVFKSVIACFGGNFIPHYYQRNYFRWLNTCERISLCVKAMFSSKHGDFIFLQGTGLLWVMLLMLIKRGRHLIYWNLIFYTNDHTLKNAFMCKLLKKANSVGGGIFGTVNATELQYLYSEVFNCDKSHFPLVFDPMDIDDCIRKERRDEGYIFFGGRAKRDIECFERIVDNMPDQKFLAVISKDMVNDKMSKMKNLEIYIDIPEKEFYEKLSHASICCIPLKSMEPCGLFVMQHAILMGIPIVSTETYSMRTIIPDDNYGFLCRRGDDKAMVERILQINNDTALRCKITDNAFNNMKSHFSHEAVASQMADAIKSVINIISK